MEESHYQWVYEICNTWADTNPAELLEYLMSNDECPAFGPIHHFLVGATLLTCTYHVLGRSDLNTALNELESRASCVPGAACAKWGVCGAAASCGMAFAIVSDNAPLRSQGWSEGQEMVSAILLRIAQAGAPRCCKRDGRIAIRTAVPWFNRCFDIELTGTDINPACKVSQKNSVCLGADCPYYAG